MTDGGKPTYRNVAMSLLASDVAEADRISESLRRQGWPHATRSLVIREALALLAEDVNGKTSEEIFQYFIERIGRRVGRASSTRPR